MRILLCSRKKMPSRRPSACQYKTKTTECRHQELRASPKTWHHSYDPTITWRWRNTHCCKVRMIIIKASNNSRACLMHSMAHRQMRAALWSTRRHKTLRETTGPETAIRQESKATIAISRSIHRSIVLRCLMEQLNKGLKIWDNHTSNVVIIWKRTACTWPSENSIHSKHVMNGLQRTRRMARAMKSTKHLEWLEAPTRTKTYARAKCSSSCLRRCAWRAICVSKTKKKSLVATSRPRPSPMS